MKYFCIISCLMLLIACFSGCQKTGTESKYKAYLYKQPSPDGLICVFYSNYEGQAEENARMFSEVAAKSWGVHYEVTTEEYK